MTDRQAHLLYLAFGIALSLLCATLLDAKVSISVTTGLWFELLIVLLFAAFVMEPQFSGKAAAAANSVAVVLLLLSGDYDDTRPWWTFLLFLGIGVLILIFVAYVLEDPARGASSQPERTARAINKIGTTLGSWRCMLVGALALALVTFNAPLGAEWTTALLVTSYALVCSQIQPHRLVPALSRVADREASLWVAAVSPPHELVVATDTDLEITPGTAVALSAFGRSISGLVVGYVTRESGRAYRVFAPDLLSVLPPPGSDERALRVRLEEQATRSLVPLAQELEQDGVSLVGVLGEGTSMREARVELNEDMRLELGEVLWTHSPEGRTFWQVTDATVARMTWAGDTRRYVSAQAIQIGQWDNGSGSFHTDVRSPRPVDLTFAGALDVPSRVRLEGNRLTIGTLPRSPFPVVVDLGQLSRHHTAILGTTGTGKTHLAFALAKALSGIGVKVICVDSTGQYATRFDDAMPIKKGTVSEFLDDPATLAVYTPGEGSPIDEANSLARGLYRWSVKQDTLAPDAPARCVVLFEEAQNYVPEGFVIDDWGLKAKAQDTSLVVMESRKFGLGFLLISQRTAMVTKSALSQCNTIFAFQAVDQTGLDYIEGLCGPALAKGVPTLPHRTAIAMGRGLLSTTPLITHISDAEVIVP